MKELILEPVINASDFPWEVEEELALNDISTHYSPGCVGIWDWKKNEYPELMKWLLETYGEEVKKHRTFWIIPT